MVKYVTQDVSVPQLQEGLGLRVDPRAPLVACITRLVPQKGVHLIRHALFRTRDAGGQVPLASPSWACTLMQTTDCRVVTMIRVHATRTAGNAK